jgi:predicted DNA-binding ribbon-helix-helix protein
MMNENADGSDKQSEVADNGITQFTKALQSRNVRIHDRRTSVRLEPEMWNALNEIAKMEGCSIHDFCGAVHDLKGPQTSFTAALRVFLMEYYRAAAQPESHAVQVQQRLREQAHANGTGTHERASGG